LADSGKNVSAEHFDQDISFIGAQVQLDGLRGIGKIVYYENSLVG
jgi:hypothetical protein